MPATTTSRRSRHAFADITAKAVTGSFTADDKTYDGDTSATVTTGSRALSGTVSGDDVTLTGGTATFDNRNVGTDKIVNLAGATLSGTDAGNYDLTSVSTAFADITAKPITGSFTADDKTYDGDTSATVTDRSLNGTVSGDDVSLTGGTATFDNRNVGQHKTVTLSGATLSGADAGNYDLTSVSSALADITAKPITGSFTAESKTYDGDTSATVTSRSLSGTIAGDAVSLTGGTATFADRNVGTDKTVTLTGATLSGADATNYNLTSVSTALANITSKELTGSFTAEDKTYDGNADAAVAGSSLPGVIGTDDVTLEVTGASFDDRNVGTNKTVTADLALSGAAAGNYSLSSITATTTADITPKELTGSFTADDKTYDGNTDATVAGSSLPGVIGTDDVTLEVTDARFDDKNVGTNKTVTADLALSGADAGNYSLSSDSAEATADITAKPITGSFTAEDKIYDGTTDATVIGRSLDDTITGDAVGLTGGSASFDDKNVGQDKTVTLTGAALSGSDATNYSLTSVATTTASITPRDTIIGSFTVADKTYDGTTAATITGRSLAGTVPSDDVSLTGGSATFDDKNVGLDKTVTGTGFTLGGADAGNYALGSVSHATADIDAKLITGSFAADDKTYDGDTSATITDRSLDEPSPATTSASPAAPRPSTTATSAPTRS